MRLRLAILVVLSAAAAWSLAAMAQAKAEQPGMRSGVWQRLPGPLPADSGKPMIPAPAAPVAHEEAANCVPALPCGSRLLGTVRKNGAVELQVPAFRW